MITSRGQKSLEYSRNWNKKEENKKRKQLAVVEKRAVLKKKPAI